MPATAPAFTTHRAGCRGSRASTLIVGGTGLAGSVLVAAVWLRPAACLARPSSPRAASMRIRCSLGFGPGLRELSFMSFSMPARFATRARPLALRSLLGDAFRSRPATRQLRLVLRVHLVAQATADHAPARRDADDRLHRRVLRPMLASEAHALLVDAHLAFDTGAALGLLPGAARPRAGAALRFAWARRARSSSSRHLRSSASRAARSAASFAARRRRRGRGLHPAPS